MNEVVFNKAFDKALHQMAGLIDEQRNKILHAMGECAASHDGESAFKYPVSFKVTLEPAGSECKVSADVSYGVRHKSTSIPERVSAEDDMFRGQE